MNIQYNLLSFNIAQLESVVNSDLTKKVLDETSIMYPNIEYYSILILDTPNRNRTGIYEIVYMIPEKDWNVSKYIKIYNKDSDYDTKEIVIEDHSRYIGDYSISGDALMGTKIIGLRRN